MADTIPANTLGAASTVAPVASKEATDLAAARAEMSRNTVAAAVDGAIAADHAVTLTVGGSTVRRCRLTPC